MYRRGYDGRMMKQGWRTFMERNGEFFSKSKRKDLTYWFWRMLQWACHDKPRVVPAGRRHQYHRQHQQQQQQQQQHLAPVPAQAQQLIHQNAPHQDEFLGGGDDYFELGGGGDLHAAMQAAALGGMEEGNEEIAMGNGGHGVNMGQVVVGNGVTFEEARANIGELQHLAGNAKIDLYDLPDDLVPPEGIFDDLNDNSGHWTDVLIAEHGETIRQQRPHLKKAVTNSETRRKNRRIKCRGFDDNVNEATPEVDLGNRCYKYFCVFCFQRYQKYCAHTADLCRQGRVLRQLATLLHHGGQLPPPLEQ
jgi:hypothetical protein